MTESEKTIPIRDWEVKCDKCDFIYMRRFIEDNKCPFGHTLPENGSVKI